jgi:acetyl-CoA C-acetyltransferase
MGESSDEVNRELEIGRNEQDEWAARSHQRAAAARQAGRLAEETVSVGVPQRRGEQVLVDADEGIRPDTTAASLAMLPPAFQLEGTITVGNASQISDGAAALVLMAAERAQELGLQPLAEVISLGMSADRYAWLHTVPALALHRALEKAGLRPEDLELVEINEAFAAVALNSARMLGLSEDRVNVNGGAVALGHPIGASGARLALTLAYELRRRGARYGAAALCGGGGQGEALILRNPAA